MTTDYLDTKTKIAVMLLSIIKTKVQDIIAKLEVRILVEYTLDPKKLEGNMKQSGHELKIFSEEAS